MTVASTERRNFIPYPTNRVVGTVGDADKSRAAIEALIRAGFQQQDIEILHGEEDLKRLDLTGADHGILAQLQRTLIRTLELDDFKDLAHHVEDLRAGRYVIMVLTKRRVQRIMAADILHQYGAEFVGFYGRWAWEGLGSSAQRTPEDIPALFARAWNDRDPDALAALFDEDAEFVNDTGLCWHDRESIRKAHAHGLERVGNTSLLAIDDMKVKLLSPDVAVVHTRMTISGQTAGGAAGHPGPGTSIVSFVVHRTVDRWQCASVHNTDAVRTTDPGVMNRAGLFGLANYPTDQMS